VGDRLKGERSDRRLHHLVAAAIAVYVATASAVTYLVQYQSADATGAGLFSLSFGFGPLVESMVVDGRYAAPADGFFKPMREQWAFTAHRMPLIPWFLAAVAAVRNSIALAMLVKAVASGALLWAASLALLRASGGRASVLVWPAVPLVLMPSLANIGFSLQMEEGYLIPMMFFLFCQLAALGLDDSGQVSAARWWVVACVNSLLYLAKASMWPLMATNAVLFPVLARRARTVVPFALLACLAIGLWGVHNLWNSGRFRLGNTWTSWCLYKGNSPHTADIYPEWSVDRMDYEGLVESPADFADEWAYEAHNKQAALGFIKQNPSDFVALTLTRARVFFVSVLPYPTLPADAPGSVQARLEPLDVIGMIVFRIAMATSVLLTLFALAARGQWVDRATARLGTAFMLFVGAYSVAYLLGFGYHRHVLPIVLPTFAMLGLLVCRHRSAADGSPATC
jgi:hypothetical protein